MSMLRSYTPADALTIGNAACGTIAIFLCLNYLAENERRFLWTAFLLLPLALVCDVLDGYVARLNRKRQSVLGADLDSLADVISFGVAPAVLGFTLGLRGGWDMLILAYFVVCGVSRLARFNVTADALADAETGKVKVLRGDADPDEHPDRRAARRRVLPGTDRRAAVVRGGADRTGGTAPARPGLRSERVGDDQRDASDPEAVGLSLSRYLIPSVSHFGAGAPLR
jgi:CDP-diacylglycerol--serine O-phosphatidyltransferase